MNIIPYTHNTEKENQILQITYTMIRLQINHNTKLFTN